MVSITVSPAASSVPLKFFSVITCSISARISSSGISFSHSIALAPLPVAAPSSTSLKRKPSDIASFSEISAPEIIFATSASPTKSLSALYFISFMSLSSTISNFVKRLEARSLGNSDLSNILMLLNTPSLSGSDIGCTNPTLIERSFAFSDTRIAISGERNVPLSINMRPCIAPKSASPKSSCGSCHQRNGPRESTRLASSFNAFVETISLSPSMNALELIASQR